MSSFKLQPSKLYIYFSKTFAEIVLDNGQKRKRHWLVYSKVATRVIVFWFLVLLQSVSTQAPPEQGKFSGSHAGAWQWQVG